MTAAATAYVRVRVPRGAFSSPLLPLNEARELKTSLRKAFADCGDRWDFVSMTGYDGREIDVRGRDVFAVEVIPESSMAEPRRLPSASAGGAIVSAIVTAGNGAVVPSSIAFGGERQGEGGEAPGTAFLRRQVGIQTPVGGGRR